MSKIKQEFEKLYSDYKLWSVTADKEEDGWQSFYPGWSDLMAHAAFLMRSTAIDQELLNKLEYCWSISEETEDLVDYAMENIKECWNILKLLTKSKDSEVRWQVYSVLSEGGDEALDILQSAINDTDSYCRRRAIISLAKFKNIKTKDITEPLLNDQDPYIRQAAIELIKASNDPNFILKCKNILLKDKNFRVRNLAKLLPT